MDLNLSGPAVFISQFLLILFLWRTLIDGEIKAQTLLKRVVLISHMWHSVINNTVLLI